MIVQPTLAEAHCHFLPLASFMATALQTGRIVIKKPTLENWTGTSICQYHLHRRRITTTASWLNVGPSSSTPHWGEIHLASCPANPPHSSTPATTWGLEVTNISSTLYEEETLKIIEYRFGVLSRDAVGPEEMVWLECDGPGHIWHTISAWEDIGQKVGGVHRFWIRLETWDFKVVVWAPKFDRYSDDLPIHLPREDPSYLTKFTLDLRSLSVTEEKVVAIQSMARPVDQIWIHVKLVPPSKFFCLNDRTLWISSLCDHLPLSSFWRLVLLKDQAPPHKCPHVSSTWGALSIHQKIFLF